MLAIRRSLAAVAMILCAPGVSAQSLTIGSAVPITSVDPHYHNLTPNIAASQHIFDALILQDEKQRLVPGLAVSWKSIDERTWEFKLRENVKWHDGSTFRAEDVVFTFRRAPEVPNSPSSFKIFTRHISAVKIVDPLTLHLTTEKPYPLLPNDLSQVAIISEKHASGKATADFNAGPAAVGTGPYKLVRWVHGDRLELARNDSYWGGKQHWEKVTIRYITNGAARVAAMVAGDVDMIDVVPTTDVARMKQDKRIKVYETPSNRVIYLALDSDRDKAPFVTDAAGQPLAKNPMKDARVRRAVAMSIDRDLIVKRVMEGSAAPAAQLVPDSFFGASKKLKPGKPDYDGAKKLLEAAGWKEGFGLTLHGPNDRYINDAKVAQAVGQMLARIGIRARVETMPMNVYSGRSSARNPEFSFTLSGWGSASGESSIVLTSLVQTYDAKAGTGSSNRGRYTNAKLDTLLDQARFTIDNTKRAALLQEAMEIAMTDVAVIPLHFQVNVWATKPTLRYVARTDEATLAMNVLPSK